MKRFIAILMLLYPAYLLSDTDQPTVLWWGFAIENTTATFFGLYLLMLYSAIAVLLLVSAEQDKQR